MERKTITSCVAIGIILLFIAVSVIPIIDGYFVNDNQIIYKHSRPKTSWFIDESAIEQSKNKPPSGKLLTAYAS
ncbi:MAG: hypothetical protein IMZ58_13145 [Thermoplasmata archaeon]|nr:hypothetical protein [Thermoplasmata archaeon]